MGRKISLLMLAAAAIPAHAAAQETADDLAPGDIVVTAQKTAQRAQDVPLVVHAVQGAALAESGATRVQDIAATIPALQVDTATGVPGTYSLTLRGINTGSQASGTVATYIDDVPIGSSGAFAQSGLIGLDLFPYDLDHVEVLEGPQGTLYGASSMGGLLKYVTRTPSLSENRYQFGGDVLGISHGSKIGWSARAAADVVVVPGTLAVGISGTRQYFPGYIDNTATGEKDVNHGTQTGARAVIYWKPTDAFGLKIQGLYNRSDFDGNGTVTPIVGGTPGDHDYTIRSATGEGQKSVVKLGSATMTYDFGAAEVTSVTSYSDTETDLRSDSSAIFGAIFGVDANFVSSYRTKKFVQEVRLASPEGERFHWLLGSFYTREKMRFGQVGVAYTPGTTTPAPGFNPFLDGIVTNRFTEWAAFANATYDLTDDWDVSGGLRYSANDQSVSQIIGGLLVGGPNVDFGKVSSKDNAVTFSASTSYKVAPDAMVYARVSSGYRPGGPNFATPGAPDSFGPDRLTNYEIGLKSDLFDRRLMLNLTAFYIDWRKIQLQGIGATGLAFNANGGRATSQGVQLETNFKASRNFSIGGAVSFTDTELKDDEPLLAGRAGDQLPLTPRWAASITADYSLPMGDDTEAHFGATWRYTGARDQQFPSAAFYRRLESYDVLNLVAGIERGPVRANLFVRNLFNSDTLVTWLANTGPVPVQPRTIGLSVDVKFN